MNTGHNMRFYGFERNRYLSLCFYNGVGLMNPSLICFAALVASAFATESILVCFIALVASAILVFFCILHTVNVDGW